MNLSEIAKAAASLEERRLQHKRRDAQIGFANNAFGAVAGAYGAKAVYEAQQKKHYPEKYEAKQVAREAKRAARAPGPARRVLGRLPKVPTAVAVSAAIGSQVLNAGMDAQSAKYFGEELKDMRTKQVKKSDQSFTDAVMRPQRVDGYGSNLNVETVSKAKRTFDAEDDRQRRIGVYQGVAGASAIGAGAGAAITARKIKLTSADRKALVALRGKVGTPALLAAGSVGAAGLTAGVHRRGNSVRNQRWT